MFCRFFASEGVEISDQDVQLLLVEFVAEWGHQAASVEDCGGDSVVVGGCSAGQIRLFVEALETGAVEAVFGIGVVAARAVGLVDLIAAGLLRSEFRQGFGRGQGGSAAENGQDRSQREVCRKQFE
jgi:hypothetical protein